jgi:hypothetical protein
VKRKTFMPDATLKALERGEHIEMRLSSFGVKVVDNKVLVTIGMEPELWALLAALLSREGSAQSRMLIESIVAGFEYLAETDDDDDSDCAN